jgi:hypothetical protein
MSVKNTIPGLEKAIPGHLFHDGHICGMVVVDIETIDHEYSGFLQSWIGH